MKRTLHFLFCLVLLTFISCKNKTKNNTAEKSSTAVPQKQVSPEKTKDAKKSEAKLRIVYEESKKTLDAYYELEHIKEFYEWQKIEGEALPDLVYPEDLSILSYEELRLLRNEVFARNGYLFSDGFLRGYFNRFKWYRPIFDVDSFQLVLNQKERNLVQTIVKEEKKRKQQKKVEKNGLQLYNADLIVNSKQFTGVPREVIADFKTQNFSIVDAGRSMPFYVYDKNAYQHIPHYITCDLYLFILHKYFSRFLEKLDENYLRIQLLQILQDNSSKLQDISEADNQAALDWARMYNSLALYAIGDSLVTCPEKYTDVFTKEKEHLDALAGKPLFISNDFVNYNELKPRGHYTKSVALQNYFRAFKWISLNGIDLKDDEQLKGLLCFAYSLKSDQTLYENYQQYVSVIEKIAGKEDNLSLADLVACIDTRPLSELLSEENLLIVRRKLMNRNKEKVKTVFGSAVPASDREAKRLYFLSSTHSISGEIFSRLIHVNGNKSKRPFPRALDLPSVFGNRTAQKIVQEEYKDSKLWEEYPQRLNDLQQQFASYTEWNSNYGSKALHTALAAYSEQLTYPDFMKTDAYNRKELSTSLSSWTHIKHDLILYQEKPFAAECGQGGGPEPPVHYSYVEPNLEFWESALELVNWLEKFSTKESTFAYQLQEIKEIGFLLRDVVQKELKGEKISNEIYDRLHYIGGSIEYILLGLLETDHLPERERSMALIADVYTYNADHLNVAVGHADDIYVIVPFQNEYHIARGAVFSYYEFHGELQNDEEWRKKVNQKQLPARPKWLQNLIRNTDVLEGQMQFRYPGHGLGF